MRKIVKRLIIVIVVFVFIFIVILKTPLTKYFLSSCLSRALKSDVSIRDCSISFLKGITASGANIKNKHGLQCSIEYADIKYNIFGLIRYGLDPSFKRIRKVYPLGLDPSFIRSRKVYPLGLDLKYSMKSVKFSYPNSAVINGIAKLFSMEPEKLLEFDTVDGEAYIRPKETIIKDFNAVGKDICLFANGTTATDENINYTFKLKLSDNITSRISEEIRKIFFRREDSFSLVELYLSGSIKKPSISFSTPLFKLRIR